jgi:primosomal protein N'
MEFFDLIFPQSVGPLTYRVPESLKGRVEQGMLVDAEIRKSVKRAVVLRPCFKPPEGKLKEIASIESEGPVLSGPMLRLIEWMAEYYFSNVGLVLKSILPREFFNRVKARKPAPEVSEEQAAYQIEGSVKAAAGEGFCLYHGGLSRGARSGAIEKIISGEANVVLGSRSAVFAPLKNVSLIVVLHEENTAYKADSGVRYSARDMAVLRGFEESATVLLTSICPSVESWHNAEIGKYTLIEAPSAPRPEVRVIDMRRSKDAISKKLREAAKSRIEKGQRAMFVVNRRGYSMLRCGDCQHVTGCKDCGVPLIYFKADTVMRCSYCGASGPPPETCPDCGGLMEAVGAGVERVLEEMDSLSPLSVEKGEPLKVMSDTDEKLIVGTKAIARQDAASEGFKLSALLNAESYRYVPDFRATERAFKELLYLADKTSPGGQIFIQSMSPGSELLKYIRRFNFRGFYRDELSQREALGYPPFTRMVLLTSPSPIEVGTGNFKGVEVLGPVPALTKKGKKIFKLLLKSASRKDLRIALKKILKGRSSREVTVDVDPIWV